MSKLIALETKTIKKIRTMPPEIKSLARMINEEGARRIEDGLDPLNVLVLVNTQLVRLVDGSISKCINPHCDCEIGFIDLEKNPLIMACCDECATSAVFVAAKKISENLRLDILEIQEKIRRERKEISSSAVRKGDIVDRSQIQRVGRISEVRLKEKEDRLKKLNQVIAAIHQGAEVFDCNKKGCGEEIPLPARINSPEVGYCLACRSR